MWSQLPPELKLAVADACLPLDAVKALASIDRATYNACLPATFRNVRLYDYKGLQAFLQNVPSEYVRYIHRLDLCIEDKSGSETVETKTKTVTALLASCICLKELTLRLEGSLHHSLTACFRDLTDITRLTITNCSDENDRPLSERFVVSVCASLPSLEHISLDRITRSVLHAPELHGQYPYIPLVRNDDTIPNHPALGSALSLPSLLSIPTLKSLCIRDTHLGDPLWETSPVKCQLQKLDLGAYSGCDEDFNRVCTERIMSALSAGRTTSSLVSLSLTTSLSSLISTPPPTTRLSAPVAVTTAKPQQTVSKYHLPSLRKLQLSPFFPIDSVVDTMTHLASSPIERVEMQCYEDDVVDVCERLEEFIALRMDKGRNADDDDDNSAKRVRGFFENLQRIDLVAVRDQDGTSLGSAIDDEAIKKLQRTCREAKLLSSVSKAKFSRDLVGLDLELLDQREQVYAPTNATAGRWADGRVRSNTI
ncbi:hypothetical protein K435DRAFT_809460 [Dendrothele bispora CBS 962.96]|uniref:F-box domain-containing protein n=1 Tax=Dendrothele bispora (strain CBS 962.96) TaxID=1314807 RepID=A0A4S8KYL4_DENBC|nr:hypothetical protein K435DRAFT_809460 [Dendrothele bispora CBS 962.96]